MGAARAASADWGRALAAHCAKDPELAVATAGRACRLAWSIAGVRWAIRLSDGSADIQDLASEDPDDTDGVDFELRAADEVWDAYLQPTPPAGRHDPMPMWISGDIQVEGDVAAYVRNLAAVRRVLELARMAMSEPGSEHVGVGRDAMPGARDGAGGLEPIVGRYVRLRVLGSDYRVYFEEAGAGPPVLLLHTAAADGRQYRQLLTDADYHGFRMIAIDLPYHGRSLPPSGWWRTRFQLEQAVYAEVLESFIDALGLQRPALVGASMASQIVLELLSRRPRAYRSIAAIGMIDHVGGSPAPWLHHPELNESEVVPNWVVGMTAPQVSEQRRKEVHWVYSQSAAGVFVGDAHFFQEEWDIRDRLGSLDISDCTLRLFAGEYDYSRPPHRVRAAAAQIPGAGFTVLTGCGHFPMVEDPEQLKLHLLPLLDAE